MRGIRLTCAGLLLASLFVLVTTREAPAGGFYIPPKGATGVGLGNAGGPAGADDGSITFFNPAGMTQLEGLLVQTGVDFIIPSVTIRNTGSTATTPGTLGTRQADQGSSGSAGLLTPTPHLYAAFPLALEGLWFGLAVTSPFGLSLEYEPEWFGRYDSIKNQLITFDMAPSLAYQLHPSWSIGAGINFQYATAELSNALPNTLRPEGPTPATDGLATLTGSAWSLGFNVGVLFHPTSGTRIGLHYRSGIRHRLTGHLTLHGPDGPLAVGNGTFETSTRVDLPPIVALGITQALTSRFTLLAQVQWFGWESFDAIRIAFHNGNPQILRPQEFRDAFAVAVAAEYAWTPRWTVRGGVRYDQTPTVDAFRNTSVPDSNLWWLSVGVTYAIAAQSSINIGYMHGFSEAEDIDLTQTFFDGTAASGTVNIKGKTDNHVDVIAINARFQF